MEFLKDPGGQVVIFILSAMTILVYQLFNGESFMDASALETPRAKATAALVFVMIIIVFILTLEPAARSRRIALFVRQRTDGLV